MFNSKRTQANKQPSAVGPKILFKDTVRSIPTPTPFVHFSQADSNAVLSIVPACENI